MAALLHHFESAFIPAYRALFPRLTMGLALLVAVLRSIAYWKRDERYTRAAHFWTKALAVAFLVSAEFQWGRKGMALVLTDNGWPASPLALAWITPTLVEGILLGLLLVGGERLSRRATWGMAMALCASSWTSGFLLTATDLWMHKLPGHGLAALAGVVLRSVDGSVLWNWLSAARGAAVLAAGVTMAVRAYTAVAYRYSVMAQEAMIVTDTLDLATESARKIALGAPALPGVGAVRG